MISNILLQVNVIDLLIAIILVRVCIVALKTGLVSEAFKLLGTITATYLSLHYFITIGDVMKGGVSSKSIGLELIDFVSFVLLALLGYGLFVVARLTFSRFIKAEAIPKLNRIGALILGIIRGSLASGLIVFMLFISSVSLFRDWAASSYFGAKFYQISFSLYRGMWNGFFSKVMPQESFNNTLLEIHDTLIKK